MAINMDFSRKVTCHKHNLHIPLPNEDGAGGKVKHSRGLGSRTDYISLLWGKTGQIVRDSYVYKNSKIHTGTLKFRHTIDYNSLLSAPGYETNPVF